MKKEKDISELFRRHYGRMYNLALCILNDGDESKDVVSEVFTQVLADNTVLLPGSEEHYLMRSVRNRCYNLIAHKSVREKVGKLLLSEADTVLRDDSDERLERVAALIGHLEPPVRRRIVRLRFFEEKTYQEVADEVGVSKVTVFNHLSQALAWIRAQMNNRLDNQ